ncbi:hypothetical protein TB1_029003 [Malus domestica]
MTYVLSTIFDAKHNQPSMMEGDYMVTEPMMAHVSVEEAGQGEPNHIGLPKQSGKKLERIYSDKMVANHLKPIYVTAHLE